MTTTFYVPSESIRGNYVVFPESERRHAVASLRKAEGDHVVVVDGEGGWYRVQLDQVSRSNMAGHIIERRREVGEPAYRLTIAISLLKQRDRFETFLEKSVELGVYSVIPLVSQRTEKKGFRKDRAERILEAGLKQTGRSRKPLLQEKTSFRDVLRQVKNNPNIVCHERAHNHPLSATLSGWSVEDALTIFIGPEGGFSDEEIAEAEASGSIIAHLGNRRLRAETAAIYVAAAVSYQELSTE